MARKSIPVDDIPAIGAGSTTDGDGGSTVSDANNDNSGAGNSGEPELVYGFERVDPGTGAAEPGNGEPRKRRKRSDAGNPRGERKETKGKNAVKGIELLITSFHFIAATALHCPEITLDDDEAGHIATAVKNVQDQYDSVISPITAAWVNLIMVLGALWGARAMLIKKRWDAENEARRTGSVPSPRANVHPFPAQPSQPTQAAPVRAQTVDVEPHIQLFDERFAAPREMAGD